MRQTYSHAGVQIYHGKCEDVLRELPDASVDAIVTDPPYFGVKTADWDNQWQTVDQYLAWVDGLMVEFCRLLKGNGSLYWFASPQLAAKLECLIDVRFSVLNRITWRKPPYSTKAEMFRKADLRSFFPASECIIFAEHKGADNIAKGCTPYKTKCEELKGFVFEPLRAYLEEQRIKSGLSSAQIQDGMHELTGARYVFDRHSFSRSQWALPTEPQYSAARVLFSRAAGVPLLCREYEELRREYEELRREYEELRRPFSVTDRDPYTDVWEFPTVGYYKGKHVCEKPLPLIRHILKSSTRKGAVILDPFLGSGTTALAAKEMGRKLIGIEQNADYCALAEKRLAQDLLPMGDSQ